MNGINGTTPKIVKVIAQGGLATIAVFAMWMLWNITSNHINANTEALYEVKGAIIEMSGVIKENTKQSERLEVLIFNQK